MSKNVSIVILNWNGLKMLKTYLSNVVAMSADCADIWVADNCSSDGSMLPPISSSEQEMKGTHKNANSILLNCLMCLFRLFYIESVSNYFHVAKVATRQETHATTKQKSETKRQESRTIRQKQAD